MNKMVLLGAMLVILGLGCVGGSFITATHTETYKENVPVEEEVTKTREVPVETQVPKTREVEKQKTVTEKENVPVFKDSVSETLKFDIQTDPHFAQWAFKVFKFKSSNPTKFVIRQPTSSKKKERYWYISFTASSTASAGARTHESFLRYYHEYPDAYICYYQTFGNYDCNKWENLDPNEYVIIVDPKKLANEEMKTRFKTQSPVEINIFFSILEFKEGEWVGIPLKLQDYNTIPYLEVHLFDHYELKEVSKTITYKETETYYETETVMKQETYTEKVTTQKEETKTREVKEKPYAVALWPGIALFLIGIIGVGAGLMKKTTIQPQAPSSKKFCSSCGKENDVGSAFCVNCGGSLK